MSKPVKIGLLSVAGIAAAVVIGISVNNSLHPAPTSLELVGAENANSVKLDLGETLEYEVKAQQAGANLSGVVLYSKDEKVMAVEKQQSGEVLKVTLQPKATGSTEIYARYGKDVESQHIQVKVINRADLEKRAGEVDKLIAAIGEVTLQSKPAIDKAKKAYQSLPIDAVSMVKNKAVLDKAEAALLEKAKEEAAPVVEAINAIGDVTMDSEAAIQEARSQFGALSPEGQKAVSNSDALKKAETRLEELKAAAAEAERKEQEKNDFKAGCETIDYADAARNPASYLGKHVQFTGKVIQVVEGYTTILRVNVTEGNYGIWKDTLYVEFTQDGASRILEDDIVTLYGTMKDLKSYQTVMGATVTIPQMKASYIDR